MDTHQEVEAVLNADEEVLPVVDVDAEFALEGVVHVDAGLNADLIILTVPVCLVGDRHAVPAVWIQGTKSSTHTSNDTLSEDVRL